MSIFKKVMGTMNNAKSVRPSTIRKRMKGFDRKARRQFPYTVGSTRGKFAKHMASFKNK